MTHPSEHQFPHSRAQTWWQFKSNGADVSQWTHLYIRVDWKPYPKTTDRPLRHLVALGLPSASDSAVISHCHMLLRWSKYKPHTTFLGMLGISLQTTTKKTLPFWKVLFLCNPWTWLCAAWNNHFSLWPLEYTTFNVFTTIYWIGGVIFNDVWMMAMTESQRLKMTF